MERPISPILDPLRSEPPVTAERSTNVEYEPALQTLLVLYASRPDLQAVFPEAKHWDFRRLVDWARRAASGEIEDSSSDRLKPHVDWFALNSVDLGVSGSVPWAILESTSLVSANPLPQTLRQMKSGRCPDISDHLITLGFLIREFDLKQVLEVGTREGYSTVALVEAATAVGGQVLSVDIEPCLGARQLLESLGLTGRWTFCQANALGLEANQIPRPIDLLFIDTFHLYTQTLSELRKFIPYLRAGSWIALHDSVSFPGVSQALLETVQSMDVKPRFYSFIHQNGLSLLRI